QKVLGQIGFGSKFAMAAPPLAVILIPIALQITSKKKWDFWALDILPMGVECILLSVPLIVLTLILNSTSPSVEQGQYGTGNSLAGVGQAVTCSSVYGAAGSGHDMLAEVITGIGAGIYEELVFRLILICLLMLLFQDVLRFDHRNSVILAVLISAALFSAHHHIDFITGQSNPNDPFSMGKFVFRTTAGVYFAGLFAIRGFGITAGTHAFYNIIAVTLNWYYFPS
ncbi:MAG: CPBP family intramembrane metalloprotease, partial [Candidatus Brocadiia bacterium]